MIARKAVTLFELMIALAILAAGIVTVLQAFAYCARSTRLFCDSVDASYIAFNAMQETELKEKQGLIAAEPPQGNGTTGKFNWQYSLEPDTNLTGIFKYEYNVSWLHDKDNQSLNLSTFLIQ